MQHAGCLQELLLLLLLGLQEQPCQGLREQQAVR